MPASNDVVVSHGMTLDQNATPEQVVWVLMSAIRDEVRTQVNTPAWKDLLKLRCRLANIELIRDNATSSGRTVHADANALFFSTVKGWAPALNYYTEYFDEDFEAARARMVSKSIKDPRLPDKYHPIHAVNYVLTTDDLGEAGRANGGVNIQFALSKTSNGYWRVYEVALGPPPAPAPAS